MASPEFWVRVSFLVIALIAESLREAGVINFGADEIIAARSYFDFILNVLAWLRG